MHRRTKILALAFAWAVATWTFPVAAAVSSYPSSAIDVIGVTGADDVGLGVPDYFFVNDLGAGFGGTNDEVFDVGESVVLEFAHPLRSIPSQHDLIVYAFVGGLGATDNATVQVELSTDGMNYVLVDTFDTEDARNRVQDFWENDFEAVKQFFVEFGGIDGVTHVRLTNAAGTVEGFRLDAVEGLHPDVVGSHAFEIRLERIRQDSWQQFRFRIKNIADPGGIAIREIRVLNSTNPLSRLEQTEVPFESVEGDFICVENCVPNCSTNCGDPEARIPFARFVWSIDGSGPAPPNSGLEPGQQAAHIPAVGMDTDSPDPYLSGYSFEVTFVDGFTRLIDYDADVTKEIGSLYEKHPYYSETPINSWNRPVDFYEHVSEGAAPPAVPGLSGGAVWLLVALLMGGGTVATLRRRSR